MLKMDANYHSSYQRGEGGGGGGVGGQNDFRHKYLGMTSVEKLCNFKRLLVATTRLKYVEGGAGDGVDDETGNRREDEGRKP